MRFLGIDFGEKRIGLAISDADGCVATPLRILLRRSDLEAIGEIVALIAEEEVDHVVIGEPRGPDGVQGSAADRVRSFAGKLLSATRIPVSLTDESLTSREAANRMGARRGRALDAVAAQILLQQALDEPTSLDPLHRTPIGDDR